MGGDNGKRCSWLKTGLGKVGAGGQEIGELSEI